MKKAIFIITSVITLVALVAFLAFDEGREYQKGIHSLNQIKMNEKTQVINTENQTVADKEAEIQVVYKDRIVVKTEYINKEVKVYEKSKVANGYLDPEFIRLHDIAASSSTDVDSIAASTSGTKSASTGVDTTSEVTLGEAISVITNNYNKIHECREQVAGWNRFYDDVRENINKRD